MYFADDLLPLAPTRDDDDGDDDDDDDGDDDDDRGDIERKVCTTCNIETRI